MGLSDWWQRRKVKKTDALYGYLPDVVRVFELDKRALFSDSEGNLEDNLANFTIRLQGCAKIYVKNSKNDLMHYYFVRMVADVWREAAKLTTDGGDATIYRGYSEEQRVLAVDLRDRFLASRGEPLDKVMKYLESKKL